LLVAFVPGLLMLATFGLERLEAGLETDDSATLVAARQAALLERGQTPRIRPPVRANPEFPATRQPNRV
jgi:hypothetical protein